ncbi:MAG: AAA family ATPase [Candidatus Poseidoniales archaeon]|jgi:DNA repair exonuclease SbcCD ATPase subunit
MITFESITFQNFLSVGNNPTTINLNDTKTTLIHGLNGSGKSTVLDVLCYALYNKPFRRVNLPQLVNTQNKKGLLTEVVFTIGKDEFKVLRGQKPKVFKIFRNGEELDSKAADRDNQTFLEQNILKLTYKSFTQIVILGSSNFIPFMQLPSAGRRECVEDFLDIKVFSAMSIIAKERLRGLKDSLHTLTGDIGNIEFKIDVQEQHIKELESKSQADTDAIKVEIDQCQKDIHTNTQRISGLNSNIKAQAGIVADLMKKNPTNKIGNLNKIIATLQTKVQRNDKNISFYQDNDTCHTCNQDIDPSVKKKYVAASKRQVKKYTQGIAEAQETIVLLEDSARIIAQNQAFIAELQKSVYQYESKVTAIQRLLTSHQKRLEDLQNSTNDIYKDKGKLEVLQADLAASMDRKYKLMQDIEEHEIVASLLKDSGIKTQIVKKYLPVMNKLIRKHLEEFDLPIHFVLDDEFNETVSSPLHQDFSYASFSEGQKSRIDLALMFTWREIGKLKNSVTTNLLILDEVFSSSLDEDGKDRLINFLRYKLDDNQRVVVVDHTLSGNFKEKFERCVEVQRIRGFSRYD